MPRDKPPVFVKPEHRTSETRDLPDPPSTVQRDARAMAVEHAMSMGSYRFPPLSPEAQALLKPFEDCDD